MPRKRGAIPRGAACARANAGRPRRAALLAAALAALAAALPGCRGEADPEADDRVLRVVMFKPDPPGAWETLFRRFEAAHPGWRVEVEIGPASSTALHDLLAQKLRNRDPSVDVFLMDVVWTAEFAAAGWSRPLDRWFPPEAQARFLEAPLRANRFRGRLHGVPAFVDAGMLYYRRDLLERHGRPVPRTWPELVETARAIVAAERAAGRAIAGYVGQFKQYEGLVCNMLEFVESAGGHLVDPDGTRSTLSEPPALDAVRFVRDRIVGDVAPRAVLTYQESESLQVFVQGGAVFLRSWPYAWRIANDPGRSRVAGRVGVAPLPRFPGGRHAAALGGWQYGVSAWSRHPEEAAELVRFLASEASQRHLAVSAGRAPTLAALYEDPEVLAANPQFREQAEAFRIAVPRPLTPVYPAVSEALQAYFSAALADRGADLERLAREADARIDRLLALARGEGG